jgi:hypothetical protein
MAISASFIRKDKEDMYIHIYHSTHILCTVYTHTPIHIELFTYHITTQYIYTPFLYLCCKCTLHFLYTHGVLHYYIKWIEARFNTSEMYIMSILRCRKLLYYDAPNEVNLSCQIVDSFPKLSECFPELFSIVSKKN